MLDKDKFVPLFPGGWWPYIEPFFDKGGFTSIYSHLKERASRHIRIFPLSQDTFRAFQLCPYKGVRAIWEGMCPYHTIWKGQPVADGLCFSCNGEYESPSLKVLYNAIEQDLGEVFLERPLKLDYLAKQGLLLLNSSFTTEQGYADKHRELWRPFTEYLTREVFSNFMGIPIVTFGNSARDMVGPYMTDNHLWRHLLHPAYYARKDRPMETEGTFTWINEVLKENNGKEFKIQFNYRETIPF